jgi:hypothetical protein
LKLIRLDADFPSGTGDAILTDMAARERWETDLECSQCGRAGHAKMSQEDHPWIGTGDTGQRVDALTSGFEVIEKRPSQDSEINCSACGVKAKAKWV